jgi:small-conductance mechanosensitive channel
MLVLQAPYEELTPVQRARVVTNNLLGIASRPMLDTAQLVLTYDSIRNKYALSWHGMGLLTVLPADTIGTGRSLPQLARHWRTLVATHVLAAASARSRQALMWNIFWSALVLAVVGLLLWVLRRLRKTARYYLMRHTHRWLADYTLRGQVVLSSGRVRALLVRVLHLLYWAVVVLLVYSMLLFIFSRFPWTEPYTRKALRLVLSPLQQVGAALWAYLPNLITIIVIFTITRLVLRTLRRISAQLSTGQLKLPDFHPDWARPTYQIVRVLTYALMFVLIFPYLPGSDSAVFQGVSVFFGVLLSLGSSSAIANAVAGTVITYMRPFAVGDRVKLGDVVGDVVEKSLLVTRLRTIKNEEVTIPNSTVLNGHTINYSKLCDKEGVILHTTVTIGYDVPWRQVHALLLAAAGRTEGLLATPPPFVLQTALNDWYVAYELNAHTLQAQRMVQLYSELHGHIQDCFNEAGVEIMSPTYLNLRDANETTLPPDYRAAGYTTPAFRVQQSPPPAPDAPAAS